VTLVLASASPRRSQILRTLGIDHEVHAAHVDERPQPGESPEAHAERLARAKAAAVAGLLPGRWVLAGDTVVTLRGEILGQPRDEDHAVDMLLRLQGRAHRVVSALALVRPDPPRIFSGTQATEVRFHPFDRPRARAYVATGEPLDKAGAYGIQGKGAVLVEEITGDYTGVVGLPVPLLLDLLDVAGRPYRFPGEGQG
jgi:septum formation protein